MENKIRSTLNEIYFGKTKDIVNGLRYVSADTHTCHIDIKSFYSAADAPSLSTPEIHVKDG